MTDSKSYSIPKETVMEAYKKVKANRGSAGIDGQTLEKFEGSLKGNLYKIWNRMSSGSYFPPPVKAVEIPKKAGGGTRKLGIPTVGDRVAQMVAKIYLEPKVDPIFHKDSYGYRPDKSAIEAIGQARKRCWEYDFVIELDIKGLFDNIDHELLMKAVKKHVEEKWLLLYIERWLKAPFVTGNGDRVERRSGTPQGGVISPVLANLFMHYAFDIWMDRHHPQDLFERYADDVVVHCKTVEEAQNVLEDLKKRMEQCKLELHPDKTKIVYCKDKDRKLNYQNTGFEFLGYAFRKRFIKDRTGRLQFNFLPAVSNKSAKSFREKVKQMKIHHRTGGKIEMLAESLNPIIRGWLNYFSAYGKSETRKTMQYINRCLIRWAMCKYKHFRGHRSRAEEWLTALSKREPKMFTHWALGDMP
jgi:RNA-directed DNA polymerase